LPSTVVHTCNPSYLGGGDKEDHSMKPSCAKDFMGPQSQLISWAWWCTPAIPPFQEE
jgi:hypothetical protein